MTVCLHYQCMYCTYVYLIFMSLLTCIRFVYFVIMISEFLRVAKSFFSGQILASAALFWLGHQFPLYMLFVYVTFWWIKSWIWIWSESIGPRLFSFKSYTYYCAALWDHYNAFVLSLLLSRVLFNNLSMRYPQRELNNAKSKRALRINDFYICMHLSLICLNINN